MIDKNLAIKVLQLIDLEFSGAQYFYEYLTEKQRAIITQEEFTEIMTLMYDREII